MNEPAPGGPAEPASRTSVRTIVWVALIAIAVLFIVQNRDEEEVEFLFLDFTAPGWFWLTALFLGGVVVGSIAPWFRRKKPTSG